MTEDEAKFNLVRRVLDRAIKVIEIEAGFLHALSQVSAHNRDHFIKAGTLCLGLIEQIRDLENEKW